MAISDEQKIDYLWKKLGYGVSKTDTIDNKKATNESIASPLLLRGDNVWKQANTIPGVAPSSNTLTVRIYSDASGSTSVETTADITSSTNRTWLTNTADWIPPEFGSSYQIKVYIDVGGSDNPQSNGTQLFAAGSGNEDQWFFDYQSGVLNFIGTNLPANISGKKIYVSGARYVGVKGVGVSNRENDADILPEVNDTYDLGSVAQAWRNLFLSNTVVINSTSLTASDGKLFVENGTVLTGSVSPTGDAQLTGNTTLSNLDVTNLNVTGNATITDLVLTSVLDIEYGGTGRNTLIENGVAIGANSSVMGFVTGTSGEVMQIAANGTPTFDKLDGGNF